MKVLGLGAGRSFVAVHVTNARAGSGYGLGSQREVQQVLHNSFKINRNLTLTLTLHPDHNFNPNPKPNRS